MYNEELENLIDAALVDGTITEKEKQVLFKKAQAMGIDVDEFEIVLDARLTKVKKEAEEKAASSAPKSNKHGDVKKCPACGAIVPQLTGVCKECGYEFSNVGVSNTIQSLVDEIKKIRQESSQKKHELRVLEAQRKNQAAQRKNLEGTVISLIEKKLMNEDNENKEDMEDKEESRLQNAINEIDFETRRTIDSLIDSFPIPNTKNDLYDLIGYLRVEGYYEKRDQCIAKARLLFPNDPVFEQLFEEVKEEEKKEKKSNKITTITIISIVVIILGIGILGFVLHWWSWSDIRSLAE